MFGGRDLHRSPNDRPVLGHVFPFLLRTYWEDPSEEKTKEVEREVRGQDHGTKDRKSLGEGRD